MKHKRRSSCLHHSLSWEQNAMPKSESGAPKTEDHWTNGKDNVSKRELLFGWVVFRNTIEHYHLFDVGDKHSCVRYRKKKKRIRWMRGACLTAQARRLAFPMSSSAKT